MTTSEPVSVSFTFDHKKRIAFPTLVSFRGKDYEITKVGLHHGFWEGDIYYHVFSVCTQGSFLKLKLNTKNLSWSLEEITYAV